MHALTLRNEVHALTLETISGAFQNNEKLLNWVEILTYELHCL